MFYTQYPIEYIEHEFDNAAMAWKLGIRTSKGDFHLQNVMLDVDNLKVISNILNVSIDYLLNDDKEVSFENTNENIFAENEAITCANEQKVVSCPEYEGFFLTIELCGWNDGVCNAVILFEDDTFIYYQRFEKKNSFLGMIGKKYVVSISREKKLIKRFLNILLIEIFFVISMLWLKLLIRKD